MTKHCYKISFILSALSLGLFLMFSSCNKEDKGLSNKKTITTLKCTFPSTQNPNTKTQYVFEDNTLKVSWSPGDEIAVSDGKSLFKFKQTGEITDDGHTALFVCDSPVSLEGDSIIAVYPYLENLSFDISQQTGNLEDIATKDIYLAKAKILDNNETESLTFNPLCAIARFPKGTYLTPFDSTGTFQLVFEDYYNGNFANKLTISKENGIIANYFSQGEDKIKNISIPIAIDSGKLAQDYFLSFMPNPDIPYPHEKRIIIRAIRSYTFNFGESLSPNNIYTFSSFKYSDYTPKSFSLSNEKQTIYLKVKTNYSWDISVPSWVSCETTSLSPINKEVSSFTIRMDVDKNSDYYPREGEIQIKTEKGTSPIPIQQEAEPIPENAAEIQIHYMEPVRNVAANNIDSVVVNGKMSASKDYNEPLWPYNGVPQQKVDRYIITKPGVSNIKLYRNGYLIYDKDVILKVGKQSLVVYDLNKNPIQIDYEYPYWDESISDKDSLFKVNFVNLLFETPSVPYSGKLQYQANRQGEDTWENVGKPVAFGESTGLQTIRLHPQYYEARSQRFYFRVITETDQILEKWDGKSLVPYSDYWTEYYRRVYIHFLRGSRTTSPQCGVTQWTLANK